MEMGEVVPASTHEPVPTFTWYFVIAAPPLDPAVNATEADPVPSVPISAVGAEGVVRGVNEDDVDDASPAPSEFTARSFTV